MNRPNAQPMTDHYLAGNMMGNSQVFPVKALSTFLTEHRRDLSNNRLYRYQRNWQHYLKQESNFDGEGRRLFQGNFAAPIVNKSVDWLFAQGWTITAPAGNENVVKVLNHVWERNNKDLLCWTLGQMGGVCGDGFLLISVDNFDFEKKELRPLEESPITIKALNPSYVFPEFDPSSTPGNVIIKSAVIQYPIIVNRNNAPAGSTLAMGTPSVYSMYVDSEVIWEFLGDVEMGPPRKNPLGFTNLVPIQNLPLATSFFGISDVDEIYDTNEHLNDISDSMKKTVEYQGEPLTVMFGARAENIVRSANKMLSGLPTDARIENVRLETNQAASKEMHEIIRRQIHINSNTPEQAFGEMQSLGNVTQAALKIQYMPLWEKTKRKYLTYGAGFVAANAMILRIMEVYHGIDLERDYGIEDPSNRYVTQIKFKSPFPQDEEELLKNLESRQRIGGISNAQIIRELDYNNADKISEEIMADRISAAMQAVENAQANAGMLPNIYAFLIDSIGINSNSPQKFKDAILAFVESKKLIMEHNEALQKLNENRQLEGQLEQQKMDMERAKKEEAAKEAAAPTPAPAKKAE